MFDRSNILITGGTGSFGRAFVSTLLQRYNPSKIIVFSRDEMKQWEMANELNQDPRLRFFIGDVRDADRLRRAFSGIDYVVHAAATKIVTTAEYNPFECIKTNINGAVNVIDAAMDSGVKSVVALSTDKASSPVNLYGASKLCSDKLFVAANAFLGGSGPVFSVVRYGNVMGSRGSIIPFFKSLQADQPLPITHPDMTRFMISLNQGIDLVKTAFAESRGGEIYVKKTPSMKVVDIAAAVRPGARLTYVGIRPGEKLHEQMIGKEDSPYTYEYPSFFKILPAIYDWHKDPNRIGVGIKVTDGFVYSSETNHDWMTITQLSEWIEGNSPTSEAMGR